MEAPARLEPGALTNLQERIKMRAAFPLPTPYWAEDPAFDNQRVKVLGILITDLEEPRYIVESYDLGTAWIGIREELYHPGPGNPA